MILSYISDVASVLDSGRSDKYGARFPESDASVGIIDGWNAKNKTRSLVSVGGLSERNNTVIISLMVTSHRPLGFLSVKGLALISFCISRYLVSYGSSSSSRMMATFQGLGPYSATPLISDCVVETGPHALTLL